MDYRDDIRSELFQLGFHKVGFAIPDRPPHFDTYRAWVEAGRHGEMAYLSSQQALERRENPRTVMPEAGIIVVTALPYPRSEPNQSMGTAPTGQVAAYAHGSDYHDIFPPRLQQAATVLERVFGKTLPAKAYTDTGPTLERDFAQKAGLGWIGKHTCLIVPGSGSYFLLGELFVGLEMEPDPPFRADQCGSCTRCIDACPTTCIRPDRTIDARECISYHTIENKGAIPAGLREKMGTWVFGCDICQQVCPWNQRFSPAEGDPAFSDRAQIGAPNMLKELGLSQLEFNQKFKGSPIKRAKRRGYLRNIAVALGNSGNPGAVDPLIACLEQESEALVRAHAAWALGRLGTPSARTALKRALRLDPDPAVALEISAALA
jgi:epoxyqueuosine reductase